MHKEKIQSLFGVRPKVFRNTELIYSDDISELVYNLGFEGMLTEGAKHVLGWKSPNYVYASAVRPQLKLLLKNDRFSEDLSLRFNDYTWKEYPLTADKYISAIASTAEPEKVINAFMNYEVLGSMHAADTGIFEFFKALPQYAERNNLYRFHLLESSDGFGGRPFDMRNHISNLYPFRRFLAARPRACRAGV